MKKIFSTLAFLIFATSCANTTDERFQIGLKKIWDEYFEESYNDTRAMSILVVTNRKSKGDSFTCDDRQTSTNLDDKLKFGICRINVPKNHTTGEIVFAKDARQSSNDYFKILDAKSSDEKTFIKYLKHSKRTPLIFVHGFNVRYQEALLRASQIAYDLKYQGPIILFTWPAGAGDSFIDNTLLNKTYESNLSSAKASTNLFKNFLLNLQKNNIRANLLVHSMGHQVVIPALKELGEIKNSQPIINELVLNAPDFDAAEFVNLAQNIKPTSKRVTVYCSYNDKAMLASKTFNKSDRLGACTFMENLDTINISLIDDSIFGLGHGYYSSRIILNDVFQVLLGIDADKRLFIKKSEPNSTEKYFLRL